MKLDPPRTPDARAAYEALQRDDLTPIRVELAGYASRVDAMMGAKHYAEVQGLPWPPAKEG